MQTLCKSFLMSEEFEGSLGHNLHNCISRIDFGFCPLCVVKCVVKLIAWKDARSHLLRLFDFSPVCSLSVFSNAITGRLQSHTSCIFSIFRCDSVSQQLPPSLPILPILLILANTTNPANPCQSCRSYQSLPIRPCKGDHFFSEFVLLLSHSIVQLSHLPSFVSFFIIALVTFLAFLYCVYSYVWPNCQPASMQGHTCYICLAFLQCVFQMCPKMA